MRQLSAEGRAIARRIGTPSARSGYRWQRCGPANTAGHGRPRASWTWGPGDKNAGHAQREACAAYIDNQRHEGWLALDDRYDDGRDSGGTLERPALQRLIRDIEAGRSIPSSATWALSVGVDVGVTHASSAPKCSPNFLKWFGSLPFSRWRRARSRRKPKPEVATSSRRSAGDIEMEQKLFGMAGGRKKRFETVQGRARHRVSVAAVENRIYLPFSYPPSACAACAPAGETASERLYRLPSGTCPSANS